jgi:hypothetical protein
VFHARASYPHLPLRAVGGTTRGRAPQSVAPAPRPAALHGESALAPGAPRLRSSQPLPRGPATPGSGGPRSSRNPAAGGRSLAASPSITSTSPIPPGGTGPDGRHPAQREVRRRTPQRSATGTEIRLARSTQRTAHVKTAPDATGSADLVKPDGLPLAGPLDELPVMPLARMCHAVTNFARGRPTHPSPGHRSPPRQSHQLPSVETAAASFTTSRHRTLRLQGRPPTKPLAPTPPKIPRIRTLRPRTLSFLRPGRLIPADPSSDHQRTPHNQRRSPGAARTSESPARRPQPLTA